MQPRAHRPKQECSEMARIICVQSWEQEGGGQEGGRGQEVGVRLKAEKTLGEGQWKKALDWRDGRLPILLSVVSDIFQGVRIHSMLVT